ncbi:sugar phosphate nucleotidyltransferase [Citreimonas sp.]|uniref:sugar phosphate nucleotidyltransferase n=1 Tax=Citreimonas sp. TaxID=3036715 RepID=UPI0035C79708
MPAGNNVAAIMLAGGRGSRLHELTDTTCKPALPFGPGHRIVDWTMANLQSAGLRKVVVATQYMPAPLERHVSQRWTPRFDGGLIFAQALRLTGRPEGFSGTADAVRRSLGLLRGQGVRTLLVVAADHVYSMDYTAMLDAHAASGAAVTVAVTPVPRATASGFGIVQPDAKGRIAGFLEKPADPPGLPDDPTHALASMGIYAFDLAWLEAALADGGDDFGYDILPRAVAAGQAACHRATRRDGAPVYWQDVGTLDAYHAVWTALGRDAALCPGPFGSATIDPGAGAWLDRDVVAMPGSRLHRDAQVRNAIVAPGVCLERTDVIGACTAEDARWFRITEGGVRLVTRAMMARRAERRPRLYPMPADPVPAALPAHAVAGRAIGRAEPRNRLA